MALIETENLSKNYYLGTQVIHAVADISMSVERGELIAIMGPSGSGKSTFMNLLGCLDTPSSGSYFLDGKDVSALTRDKLAKTRNRKIGFVFQGFNLLPRTTALENVELPMKYSRTPRRERKARAAEVLEAVGLGDRAHHYCNQLSGGQLQRVAVARALVNHPDILLADEPTGALDSRTGLEIMSLFQSLNAKGITIALITHEQEIAHFAGRIIRFLDGRIVSRESVSSPSVADDLLSQLPAEQRGS